MPRPHRIVIVAFPPAQMLDVTGPLDVFSAANEIVTEAGRSAPYEVLLASPGAGPVPTTSGIAIHATLDVFNRTLRADTLILAGGPGARSMPRQSALVEAVTALCRDTARVASICTGAFALAATGLLGEGPATTHWAHFDEFEGVFPQVAIDRDALFITEGKYHSSAGISAGIDYALALVEHDLGRKIALRVARELVVFLKRPGGQSQFSAHLAAEVGADDPDRFGELGRWLAEHLDEALSIDLMAERMAMSPRNFARRFKQAMNVTPSGYLQTLRVDAARRMLSESALSVARIARRCGFASTAAMKTEFQRHLQVGPEEFRARFQSTGAKI
ncbi:MAG: GlxA family transcriptional regulator [Massilia sp.]